MRNRAIKYLMEMNTGRKIETCDMGMRWADTKKRVRMDDISYLTANGYADSNNGVIQISEWGRTAIKFL